ncbi:MAG: Heat shock protein 60 family chaperone GroEL [Nitrospira sp.]|jgi:hypothetical protein|nr:Heat shock protein 60 family chaperone GroEL [Nitrospira sp.]
MGLEVMDHFFSTHHPHLVRRMTALILSTEVVITELPEEKKEPAMPGGGHSRRHGGMH